VPVGVARKTANAVPAYWRLHYCLGDLIPFWWTPWAGDPGRASYRRVTGAECQRHGLWPVFAFTQALAEFSGLEWFSTELCLSDGPEASRYRVRCLARDADGNERDTLRPVLAIDYLNDQCDVDVQSRWAGAPPDDVVH